jgi:hypothetical protein
MPALMRSALNVTIGIAALLLCGVGCGKEIGDACVLDSECDPNGERICATKGGESGGYCTIQGCDYNTCPEDSVCIRFFTGGFTNRPCDHQTEDVFEDGAIMPLSDACTLDELCSLEDLCVPRSSESRYCMATCSDGGDCRDSYECRDLELMIAHGGEPVLAPGKPIDDSATKFCAPEPVVP